LKLGSIEIKFAEKRPSKPVIDELGATGTTFFGGSLSEEEYNNDLRGSKGIVIYDKMRKSDARVKFALMACELPLRAATWSIEPASDEPKDKEIAEALKDNLFEHMTITWDSFLHHALLMLPFGFMVFEKVWEIVDGQVRYRKLAPRLPKTLYKWKLDTNGGLAGIEQWVWKNEKYENITIPSDKLLVFTNDKEGSNFEGVSILRTAYKHWYYKDNLYRIDGIAAERHALGIPVFKHPSDASKDSKDNIDSLGQRLYANEQAYLRLANDYEFDVKGLSGTIRDIMPSISHHDRKIAESVLADFIDLGGGDRGSWALSKDKSSFFLMSLNAIATNICDTFNTYAIKPWVDYNYANVQKYPKLKVGNLETREVANYATAITNLITAGAITVGDEVEGAVRDMLKLPPKPEPTQQSERRIFKSAEVKARRELTLAEQYVDFAEITKQLDSAEEKLINAVSSVQKRQIDKLVDVVAKIIEKKDMGRLEDIDVPFRAEVSQEIESVLMELYQYGRQQVKKELATQKGNKLAEPWTEPLGPSEVALIKEFLKTRAKANANLLATKLKSAVTFEALRQVKEGIVDKVLLTKVMTDLSGKELVATAQYSISESFNWGRSAEAEKYRDDIDRAQYSSILDENTCSICEPLDGEEWDYDDPRTEKYASGNPDCEGKTRCRCLLVYIHKAERRNVR